MNKKKIYLIIGGLSLIILVLGITYAWFEWQSNTNTNVTFEVGDLGITYIGEENVLSKVLYPTASMTNPDNVIHTFSLTTSSNIDIYSKISLDIINIDEELKDESFVWKLYRNDTYIAGGNFLNAIQGSDVLLIQNEKITNELTNYTLYIWIDGVNYNNPLDMGGKSFNFKLKFEAGQVSYVTSEECFTFDESTGRITDYLCYSGNENDLPVITDVVIPSEIDGVAVTEIYGYFIYNGYGLLKLGAFKEKNLTSVVIPDSVTTIERSAFENNALTSVVIPDSVETIGDYAFSSNNLTSVVIPDSVESIGYQAFSSNNLTSLTLGNSVEEIVYRAFYNNPTLTSIKVDEENTVYDSRDNSNAIIETSTNTLIQGCKNTIIPNTVTTIGQCAFDRMGLTEIEIPDSVESIGYQAFMSNNLTSVVIGNNVTTIVESAFYRNNLTSVVIPDSVESIGYQAFSSNNLTSVVIPDSVTTIERSAFYSDSSSNPNLTTIYNTTGREFDWNNIIKGRSSTSFITGTVTTTDGRVVTITTLE